MPRVKRGTIAHKRRKYLLKYTKGFRWSRKSKYRAAREALLHAWSHSFRDRKTKKRNFRRLWQTRIGAGSKQLGISYSKFIYLLKKNQVELDRKVLAALAQEYPQVFSKIVEKTQVRGD